MVPYYVADWDPDEGDVGVTLLSLFAELAEEVTERLDRVPEKHAVSFYQTLGFDRNPPQPARLPLTVEVVDGAGENVTVPANAVATAKPPDGSELSFEIPRDGAFDATPANLRAVYSVDPESDAIYGHQGVAGGGALASLFVPEDAENLQEHRFYLGDAERLSVGNGSTLTVEIDTDADPEYLYETLQWEYYGERTVDGDTVEGWHSFPGEDSVLPAFDDAVFDYWTLTRTSTALPAWSRPEESPPWVKQLLAVDDPARENEEGNVELTLVPDGTLTKQAVDGTETKWIRCRVPDHVTDRELERSFDLQFGTRGGSNPPVGVGASADGLEPDTLLRNDVPMPAGSDDEIRPFGEHPRPQDTFYLASTDALTKTGATVTVEFEFSATGGGSPVLSWEYFDGEGWSRIPDLDDDTNSFTGSRWDGVQPWYGRTGDLPLLGYTPIGVVGSADEENGTDQNVVTFDVPDDLSETTVAGHENHWMRVRLVGGDYGKLQFEPVSTDDDSEPDRYEQTDEYVEPPAFSAVRLSYDQIEAPDHAVSENNLTLDADVPVESGSYRPFEPVPAAEQALFLGFDAPLTDGPINLLFDLEDAAYPQSFHPQVRWEYDAAKTDGWARPDVVDGTEGLTERGIVGLVFPDATGSTERFGRDRHWVVARVTGDRFGVSEAASGDGSARGDAGRACGRYVETVPPAGEPQHYPPAVRGIYPNTAWARNRRTIDSELLGSSDGSIDQTFAVTEPPVVEMTVWIDELAVLSEGGREALGERWPDRTDVETDASGEPVAFWVRWERRPDLLDSGPEDRHYTLDPIAGTVAFGDGTRGKIPPRGTDNVRASYATGGGESGNVPAGAVSGFRQSLASVDSVTNRLAAAAGADAEPTTAVTDRAARQLRDRNRAVAPGDVERIAMDSSRQLARARCLPAMDRTGAYRPGWVTLLVVPESAARKPRPSATLRQDVERAVAEKAPTTLVDLDHLVVRGPGYVTVSVETTVAATGGSVSQLEERVRGTVRSFLHPLTGGPADEGWGFGELPCRSDLYELLEGVDRVDHVVDLTVTFETNRSTVTVEEGEATPDTSPDALVHAGTIEATGTLVDDGGAE